MADIYLCGHGGWDTIKQQASVFFTLPASTQVKIYTQIGEELMLGEARDIMTKSADAKEPARVITAYRSCPNLTLYKCPEFKADFDSFAQQGGCTYHVQMVGEMKLSEFLKSKHYAGNTIHWMACGSRMLYQT